MERATVQCDGKVPADTGAASRHSLALPGSQRQTAFQTYYPGTVLDNPCLNALFLKVDWETPTGRKRAGSTLLFPEVRTQGVRRPGTRQGRSARGAVRCRGPGVTCPVLPQVSETSSRGLRIKPPGSLSTISYNHMLSGSVASNPLQPHGLQPTRLLCPWDSPGKNTGVACHALLQGIFLTQGRNPGRLLCRRVLYH